MLTLPMISTMKIKSVAAKSDGFTLLELLVTIAIAAILASIAVPAFNDTMARSRVTSNTNLIVGGINYARAEAINLGAQTTFQAIGDGWEVVSGGQQLKLLEPPGQGVSVVDTIGNIVFEASGYRTFGAAAGSFLISDVATGNIQRRICVNVSGNTRVTQGAAC